MFFSDCVIKFFHNKNVCINRTKRGKILFPLTPKILDSKDNFIKMELVEGELMSNLKTHGEISKLLNWAKKSLDIN